MDVAKILAGRQIVDAYRTAHANLHHRVRDGRALPIDHSGIMGEMFSGLKALGFNSVDEFFAANEQLCYQEKARCYLEVGICDSCEGRERGCVLRCYADRLEPSSGKHPIKVNPKDFYDWQHFPNYAPPNCSTHSEKVAEPEFDIFWSMPSGITPEQYQEMKQREQ